MPRVQLELGESAKAANLKVRLKQFAKRKGRKFSHVALEAFEMGVLALCKKERGEK